MSRITLGDVAVERHEHCKGDKSRYPVVALEHLTPEEITLTAWDESGENTFTKIFHKGDVLFGRRRAYLKKAALAPFDGICSGDITVIEAKPDYILPEILPFVIQNDAFFDFAVGKSAGSLSPRVKWEYLKEYEFNLPSNEDQKNISKILWSVNDMLEAYKKLTALTDELVKAKFVEMFGEPGEDIHDWGLTKLSECCELNPKKPKDIFPNCSYSFVAIPSVSVNGIIDVSISRPYHEICNGYTYFAENDVLFAKITPCMENGKGGVAVGLKNGIGFGSTEFHVLRPIKEKSDSYWLYIITMFNKFRLDAAKIMTGTGGQRRVPIEYLSEYKISLPPYELQKQFANFVRQSDKSKLELELTITVAKAMMKKIIAEKLG